MQNFLNSTPVVGEVSRSDGGVKSNSKFKMQNAKCKMQNATDAAEREQKPSLTWIMPSREEEKPAKQG